MSPIFIHDSSTSGTSLTGIYDYTGATLQIPSGTNPPAATQGSQFFFVPASGLLLVASGTTWTNFQFLTSAVAPSSMNPDDASVSGELRYWHNDTSLVLTTPGLSGLSSWDDLAQSANDTPNRNTPTVASGDVNGLDVAYLTSTDAFFNDAPNGISNFQGTDTPFACFAVVKPETVHLGIIFSLAHRSWGIEKQRMFGVHTAGGSSSLYYSTNDANTSTAQIGHGLSGYTAGELMLLSWISSTDGTTMRVYKNGSEITAAASGLATGAITPVDTAIGVNPNTTFDWPFQGEICEVAVYSSGLSDSDVTQINQGLINKWGI